MTREHAKTWFVTGATGSIGRAFVERLDGSVRLRVLVRGASAAAAHGRLAAALGPKGRAALADGVIEAIPGDLRTTGLGLSPLTRAAVTDDLAGVLHVAARTDFDGGDDVDVYRDDNVLGALRVLQIAEDAGCPFVHVSTAYVCGDRTGRILESELDVGQAHRNGYERSKFEAESLLAQAAATARVPFTVFRPSIVLPEHPRRGASEGPGPLAYLRLLANLEGRRTSRERVIRYRGDPDGLLNLVPQSFVAEVLARAVTEGVRPGATYHVTARHSIRMSDVAGLMNEELTGLRTDLVPDIRADTLDRYEQILERTFRIYADYLFLHHEFDRAALDRDFGVEDGADLDWLRRTYRGHLHVWRAERASGSDRRRRADDPESRSVRRYFTEFLPTRTGSRLVPGLATLSACFTVTVRGLGSYRLCIDKGVLTEVEEAAGPSDEIDYEADAAALLEAVTAVTRPAELFFDKRIVIRGDLFRALSTASALEDFFRLFPFASNRTPEPVA